MAREKILIIEDDTQTRENLELILEMEGFEVRTAPNGLAGVKVALAEHPDLILSDVLMPKLTGPEMVAQLKQRWPDLSVLFVTGYAGDASEVASFGDHDVLRKPFTLTALDQAIRRCGDARAIEEQRLAG